jgi:hypothetical protein
MEVEPYKIRNELVSPDAVKMELLYLIIGRMFNMPINIMLER